MATTDDQQGGEGGNETIVVGLIKRVMGVEARLQTPLAKTPKEEPTPMPPAKGHVQVETKVMDSPRKKAASIRTMSDFKV